MRRGVAVFAIATGLLFLGLTLGFGGFARAQAGEDILDAVRPQAVDEGLDELQAGIATYRAMVDAHVGSAIPAFARSLGQSEQQFDRTLQQQYPQVADLDTRGRDVAAFGERIFANLERHEGDFKEADAFPVSWLPAVAAPAFAVAFGLALAVAGGATLLIRSWAGPLAVAVCGLVLIAGSLAARLPQKAAATENIVSSLTINNETGRQTRAHQDYARASFAEFFDRLVPDVARALGTSSAALTAELDRQFPAIARGRAEFDAIFDNFEAGVVFRETNGDEFSDVKDIPLEATAWGAVGLGVVLLAGGVAAAGVGVRGARAALSRGR
jgi:hypothetical protein